MFKIPLFKFKGIPVSMTPFFVVLLLVLTYGSGRSIVSMLLFAAAAVVAILVHEFGHALVAKKYHLSPEISLEMFGGRTSHEPAMSAKEDFKITLMGPLMNLLLGGVSAGLYAILAHTVVGGLFPFVMGVLAALFYMMAMVNIFWGVFNLLPAKPMDGFKVLDYLLSRKLKLRRADWISMVVSVIFVGLIVAWSIWRGSIFMMCISAFFVMANIEGFRTVFSKKNLVGEKKSPKRIGIQAETLYERGLMLSRNHDWKGLETVGHQMKKASEDKGQLGRAYELLTVACTNLGKYEEALKYSERANQTDSVKQAAARCKSMLG